MNKEYLGYVNKWTKKVPYPGKLYAFGAMKKLVECFDAYILCCRDKKYYMTLSNGEYISLEMVTNNLCYLLGINCSDLISDYYKRFRMMVLGKDDFSNSYDLLLAIIKNANEVVEYDDRLNKQGCSTTLNYYNIMVKCTAFLKMLNLSKNNFGIINIDESALKVSGGAEFYHKDNNCYFGNTSKFIYLKSDDDNVDIPYYMMGIKEDKFLGDNKYIVESILVPRKGQFRTLFNNQEVVIPTEIVSDMGVNNIFIDSQITDEERESFEKEYEAYIEKYNFSNKLVLDSNDKKLIRK